MIIRSLLSAVVALTVFATSTAFACPPPPPGAAAGRSVKQQKRLTRQRTAEFPRRARSGSTKPGCTIVKCGMWDEADSVIIARITRVRHRSASIIWGDVPHVTLARRPHAQRPPPITNSFDLRYTDATSCGPMPAFDAIQGQVGDEFVIFLRGGRPGQRTVQQTTSTGAITDTRITEAIAAR